MTLARMEPMSHEEFRSILREAIARATARGDISGTVVEGDLAYLAEAIEASERFDIDAETVSDALAIAAEH